MESSPGGDAKKAAWMTIKDLKYFVNLLIFNKPVVEFEKIDPNLERSSSVSKMLLKSFNCYRKIILKRKRQCCIISRNCR